VYRQDIDNLLVEYEPIIKKVADMNPIYSPFFTKDDLTQEFMMILLRCNELYNPNKGASFKSYFIQSCKHYVWDERNRHKAEGSLDEEIVLHGQQHLTRKDVLMDDSILQDEMVFRYAKYDEVVEALQQVTNGDLVLRYLTTNVTFYDIAREQGISHQAVQQKYQKALSDVRLLLGVVDNFNDLDYNKE
jgi:RNA polymerase sigma factor (sigma-70 family)